MARCNCSGLVCACVLTAGDNVTVTGAGSTRDPYVIAAGSGGGGGGDTIPPGVTVPYGGSAAPPGWLLCQGQAVSRTTYADLFAAVGTRFGAGDGASTFNVPNMVDRFPVGAGGKYAPGSSGGAETVTLTVAMLPVHTHTINHDHGAFNTASTGGHRHKLQTSNDGTNVSGATLQRAGNSGAADSDAAVETTGAHAHSINVPAFAGTSGATGSGQGVPIVPRYTAFNYLVKT
jgi:microcystin-dependent protein